MHLHTTGTFSAASSVASIKLNVHNTEGQRTSFLVLLLYGFLLTTNWASDVAG